MTGQYLDLSRLLKVQKFCVYTTKCNYNITSWTDKTHLAYFQKLTYRIVFAIQTQCFIRVVQSFLHKCFLGHCICLRQSVSTSHCRGSVWSKPICGIIYLNLTLQCQLDLTTYFYHRAALSKFRLLFLSIFMCNVSGGVVRIELSRT